MMWDEKIQEGREYLHKAGRDVGMQKSKRVEIYLRRLSAFLHLADMEALLAGLLDGKLVAQREMT